MMRTALMTAIQVRRQALRVHQGRHTNSMHVEMRKDV